MLTTIVRIHCFVIMVPLIMTGHWIWAIAALVFGLCGEIYYNGKVV